MANPNNKFRRRARKRGAIVLSRRQWGSRYESTYAARRRKTKAGGFGRFVYKADTVVFHITVTHDTGLLVGDFKTDMQTVERIGYERFSSGFSYNLGIDMRTGMIGVGQPFDSKGTHTVNDKAVARYSKDQNLAARAIAFLGMPGDPLSDDAVEAAVDALVAMWEAGTITEDFDLVPHSMFAFKDCPTQAVRDKMPEIERRAKARIRRAMHGKGKK